MENAVVQIKMNLIQVALELHKLNLQTGQQSNFKEIYLELMGEIFGQPKQTVETAE